MFLQRLIDQLGYTLICSNPVVVATAEDREPGVL